MGEIEELSESEDVDSQEINREGETEAGSQIDFTAPTPKDFMPEDFNNININASNKLRKRQKRTHVHADAVADESDEQESLDGDSPDYFDDGGESGDDHSTKKKFIAFLMISPMLISGLVMFSDAFKKFDLNSTGMQVTAGVGGACVALLVLAKVPQLRQAVKLIFCFAWVVFLLPTYQVYQCSPIELKNTMLGTWFKLRTEPNKFLESSYISSECFREFKLQAPYKLSAISPKIQLVLQIKDLINLEASNKDKEVKSDTREASSYFLALSKRSVKKKFHNIYLIIEADGQQAQFLSRTLKLTADEKDKNLVVITGTVAGLEEELSPMKKELEKINYLVRPIKFRVVSASYRDKYVKLKNTGGDESMY